MLSISSERPEFIGKNNILFIVTRFGGKRKFSGINPAGKKQHRTENGLPGAISLKKIQHIVQINCLPHLQLVFRLCHVVEQKFQHQCAAKSPALYFKVGKTCGQIPLPDVLHPDEPGATHRLGKAIALGGIRGGAAVVRAVLAQILTADRLVAALALGAAEPAALVAQKLYLGFLLRRQGAQLLQCRV